VEPLRIAVVGCGEAAQILHLPTLALLRDRFAVTALCDASARVVEEVGRRWNVPARETEWRSVVARDDVDAVLVAVPEAFHADVTVAALEAGKHVLVEKPLCLTLREADEIEAARRVARRVVQVGYVRRYAPAVALARELVEGLGGVRFARFRDILGLNPLVVEQTTDVVRADDGSGDAAAEAVETRDRLVEEAIGPASRDVAAAYRLLLSLGCHDVSLMRELLGRPRGVLYAATRHEAWYVSAAFDYGSFVCHLELGFDRIPRVEATAEVYGLDRVVRLAYDTPFVRSLPVRLHVTEAVDGRGVSERALHAEWADPFVREWEAFHAAVASGAEPKTSVADARHDLELFAEMAGLMH
jgi:predicted dehydrogenase